MLITLAFLALTAPLQAVQSGRSSSEATDTPAANLAASARAGDRWAMLELGRRYEVGDGVVANRETAIRLYSEAAQPARVIAYLGGTGLVEDPASVDAAERARPAVAEANRRLERLGAQKLAVTDKPLAFDPQLSEWLARRPRPLSGPKLIQATYLFTGNVRVDVLSASNVGKLGEADLKVDENGRVHFEHAVFDCPARLFRIAGTGTTALDARQKDNGSSFVSFDKLGAQRAYEAYFCRPQSEKP